MVNVVTCIMTIPAEKLPRFRHFLTSVKFNFHIHVKKGSRERHVMLETRHTLYNNLLACAAVDEGQVGNLSAVRHNANASTWASQTNTRQTATVVCLPTTKQEIIAILWGKKRARS